MHDGLPWRGIYDFQKRKLTTLLFRSYGGREVALQEKAKATGNRLLGEAKSGMGAVEATGREVVQEGKEMLAKVEKKLGK